MKERKLHFKVTDCTGDIPETFEFEVVTNLRDIAIIDLFKKNLNASIRNSLVALVNLKEHKNKHGKDTYYRKKHASVWYDAFRAVGRREK
jgi:hypothetical protein